MLPKIKQIKSIWLAAKQLARSLLRSSRFVEQARLTH